MRNFLTILLPCVFALSAMPIALAATEDTERAPTLFYFSGCGGLPAGEQQYCLALEFRRIGPCTGSVEERLACLDRRIAEQEQEMMRLKRELERQTTPRIHPLDDRRLSQQ